MFVDGQNVVERLDYLFAHPDEIRRITKAGYSLIHSCHTLSHRPQIYQWFMLNKGLRFGEKIIQSSPFGDLTKVQLSSRQESVHIVGEARDRVLLKQGDLLLEQGRVEGGQAVLRALPGLCIVPARSQIPPCHLCVAGGRRRSRL